MSPLAAQFNCIHQSIICLSVHNQNIALTITRKWTVMMFGLIAATNSIANHNACNPA
jgi:hypothetical protein